MAALSKCYYNMRSCPTAKEIRLLFTFSAGRRRRKPRLHGRDQTALVRYHRRAWDEMEAGREQLCREAVEPRPRSPAKLPLEPDLSSVQDLQLMLFEVKAENAELKNQIMRRADMDETERRWRAQKQQLLWDAVLSSPDTTDVSPCLDYPKYLLLKAKERLEANPKSTDPDPTDGAVEAKEVEEVQPVPERPPGQEAAADDQSPDGTSEESCPSLPGIDWDAMERLDDVAYAGKLESAWQQRQEEEREILRNRQRQHEELIADKEAVRRDKGTRREPRRQGCVTEFQLRKGWGFIREPGLYAGVFVSRRDVESHLPQGHPGRDLINGDLVTYTRHWGLKGWYALNVEIVRDSVPDAGNVTTADASQSRAPAAPGRAPASPPECFSQFGAPPAYSPLPGPRNKSPAATPSRSLSAPPDIAVPAVTQLASSNQETPVVPSVIHTRTVATQTLIAAHDLFVMHPKEHRVVSAPGVEDVFEADKK